MQSLVLANVGCRLRLARRILLIALAGMGCGERRINDRAPGHEVVATIDSVASLRLSVPDGLFGVVGARWIDGKAVLAERSTGSLKFFTEDGQLLRSVGSQGDGPGESRMIAWLQSANNRIYTYDPISRRLSQWSADGSFLKSIILDIPERFGRSSALGVLEDGSIIAGASKRPPRARAAGARRVETILLRCDSAGHFLDSLSTVRLREEHAEPFGVAGELTSPLVFGRRGAVAVGAGWVAIAENDSAAVEVLSPSGASQVLILPSYPGYGRDAVSDEHIALARERFISDETPELPLGPVFDKMPIPDSFPALGWSGEHPAGLLRVNSDQTIWVMRSGGTRTVTPVWAVFNVDGTFKSNVTAPVEMDVLDSDSSRVLVLRRTQLDEEIVEVRQLRW